MKRMKKKVVAMVTLAMFMMTLLPMAAFAAVEPNNSYVSLDQSVVDVNTAVNVSLKDAKGTNIVPDGNKGGTVYVWAEKVDGDTSVPTRDVTFANTSSSLTETYLDNGKTAVIDAAEDLTGLKATFTKGGEYVVKAGVSFSVENATEVAQIVQFTGENNKVTVESAAVGDVDSLEFAGPSSPSVVGGKVELASVKDNNTATKTYTVTAKIGHDIAPNETITIDADNGLTVTAKDPITGKVFEDGTVTTNRKGQFEMTYSANRTGNFKIYLTAEDGYVVTASVVAGDPQGDKPANIETTVQNGQVINVDNVPADLVDAVQYEIVDQNGDVMTEQSSIANEPAAQTTPDKDYVKVLEKPDKFVENQSAASFKLVWNSDKDVYTLVPNGVTLVKGDYKVRVALEETGNYADASFTVDKAGKATDMKIKFTTKNVNDNNVALGETVTAKVVFVDENGIESDATGVSAGVITTNNNASVTSDTANNISFTVATPSNDEEKEKIVGTKIIVNAVNSGKGLIASEELTVVDKENTEAVSLAFDPTNGPARENNKVDVQIVNAENEAITNITKAGTMVAYVASQSNKDAHIDLDTTDSTIEKGKMTLKVYSDKETKADIVVGIKVNGEKTLYAKTLTYTFGKADVPVDNKLVAMTIGSSDYIVNNEIVEGDAAPYLKNNRTYVPIRALAEAFGADVEYVKEGQTVTIELGSTKIEMNIGKTAYTVNGEAKTMDVVPEAKNGRTYVPVRFVAEALGFTVTPLTGANGEVAVVFQV